MKTAAVVIIGDEILAGKFADQNGPYLIERLRALGVALRRLVTIADDLEGIAEEVRRCSNRYDYVFTTGGVGPTHDDITMVAIARAFGRPLERRAELVDVLERKMTGRMTPEALRMADIPVGADLLWDGDLAFPLVRVENVHILPGVPHILRLKFEAVAERFRGVKKHEARVQTGELESAIAARLERALELHPGVSIGSYPRLEQKPWFVIITIEGELVDEVEACRAWLETTLRPR